MSQEIINFLKKFKSARDLKFNELDNDELILSFDAINYEDILKNNLEEFQERHLGIWGYTWDLIAEIDKRKLYPFGNWSDYEVVRLFNFVREFKDDLFFNEERRAYSIFEPLLINEIRDRKLKSILN